MKQLNKELDMRIESFMNKKHQEFPELDLRGDEKHAETLGHIIADKILDSVASIRFQLSR